jgi:osmotically-inducible protein OsmY
MSDDYQLQEAVLEELRWEPSVNAAHIGVTANAGVVALTGHVESLSEKFAAQDAAGRVKGVKAVAEEIQVQLPNAKRLDDETIAAAAIARLAGNSSVPRDTIMIRVEKGWVTLSGQLDWRYQQRAACQDVRFLAGVVGLTDRTTLKTRVDIAHLSDDITRALNRSWLHEPKTIAVSAMGGAVRLTGTVSSWRDRHLAAETAWAAPGATAVENDLAVV